MAKFELNVYGNDDEIEKTLTRNIVPTTIFVKAVKLAENLTSKKKTEFEAFDDIIEIVRELFPDLKNEDTTDVGDVMNIFKQIVARANSIMSGESNPNA